MVKYVPIYFIAQEGMFFYWDYSDSDLLDRLTTQTHKQKYATKQIYKIEMSRITNVLYVHLVFRRTLSQLFDRL